MSAEARKHLDEAMDSLCELLGEIGHVSSGNLSHHIARIHATVSWCSILIERAKQSLDESEPKENVPDACGQHHAQGPARPSVG